MFSTANLDVYKYEYPRAEGEDYTLYRYTAYVRGSGGFYHEEFEGTPFDTPEMREGYTLATGDHESCAIAALGFVDCDGTPDQHIGAVGISVPDETELNLVVGMEHFYLFLPHEGVEVKAKWDLEGFFQELLLGVQEHAGPLNLELVNYHTWCPEVGPNWDHARVRLFHDDRWPRDIQLWTKVVAFGEAYPIIGSCDPDRLMLNRLQGRLDAACPPSGVDIWAKGGQADRAST